jgi:hypothetical protein
MRFPCVVAAGLAVALATNQVALAQTGPTGSVAVVGNIYESFISGVLCRTTRTCNALFPGNPSGRVVYITNVACRVESDAAITGMRLATAQTSAGGLSKYTQLTMSKDKFGTSFFADVNVGARLLVGPGKFPLVQVSTEGSTFVAVNCSVSGQFAQ